MLKKITGAWLLAVLAMGAFGQHANATLLSMPKSLKSSSPLEGVEMSLGVWGPSTKSFYCVMHLTACQRTPSQAVARQLPPKAPEFSQVRPQPEQVALFGMPKSLRGQLDRVPQDTPTLAPMAHTMFCLQYPKDCEVRKIAFRGTKLDLTAARMSELDAVNTKVNRNIRPERNTRGFAGEKWLISPTSGDCNDYAVTKRHELLKRGWPSRSLLLAEVVVPGGEHHLIVVVRTKQGDYLLDNLSSSIQAWSRPGYQWVRMQSGTNPKIWSTVKPAARSA